MVAPLADKEVELPLQIAISPLKVTTGFGITVTVICALFVAHPFTVPEIKYVVVEAGVAVTALPVVALNPLEGDHT